jgi:hypothetical protein
LERQDRDGKKMECVFIIRSEEQKNKAKIATFLTVFVCGELEEKFLPEGQVVNDSIQKLN